MKKDPRFTTLVLTVVILFTASGPRNPPASSDLAITKSAAPNPVQTGSNVTYQIIVRNNGPSVAKSVTLTDTLAASTTFVSCSATAKGVCGGTGRNRTVAFSSLGGGNSATITLVARVLATVAEGATISNTARVGSKSVDPATANNSATVAVKATRPKADLAVAISASADSVVSGSPVTYTITVANNGPSTAQSVTVTDTLAASMTFVSCSVTGTGVCGGSGQVRTVSFSSLAPGTYNTITLVATPVTPPPPYPASPVIESLSWDLANVVSLAPGSDIWPITWAGDDNLYTAWGDGGGFGGTNLDGRVSLGFAQISGSATDFTARNIWGGKDALYPATFPGKAIGMLSVGGILYASILLQNWTDFRLAWSTDLSQSWQLSDFVFPGSLGFSPVTFLNFGRDNLGARDGFIYMYGTRPDPSLSKNIYLARVPSDMLNVPAMYEFFAGRDEIGTPLWAPVATAATPVMTDANGIDVPSVVYHPLLQRYIGTTAHFQQVQKLGIFDAPEPWGPWTTVGYYDNWGELGASESLIYSLPTKWIGLDGTTMWMVFSAGDIDSFNLVRGTLVLRMPFDSRSVPATLISNTARVKSSLATDLSSANNTARVSIAVVN